MVNNAQGIAPLTPIAEKPAGSVAPAKPEKVSTAAPAAKAPVMNDIPPSAIAVAQAAAAKPPPAPIAPAPPAVASAASNSQDDIDAMLAGLDAVTSEAEIRPAEPEAQPEADVFELTDEMAVPEPPGYQRKPTGSRLVLFRDWICSGTGSVQGLDL